MSAIPFSAFDPIFWLHHTNIDRLWAIWSAINPDSYVIPLKNDAGTYAEAPGTVEDVNTPLLPFRTSSTFHTSVTVRDTKSFGYSYPEIVDWNVSAAQLAANVRTAVNRLYQRSTGKSIARRASNISGGSVTRRDWFINFQGVRQASTPFVVNFFLGEPPVVAKDWAMADNLIVSQVVLPDSSGDEVAPPAMAQIPLSRSLETAQQSGKLNGTDINSIKAYLKTNLNWSAISLSSDACEVATSNGLDISVVDQEVLENRREDQFHSYGAFNKHPDLMW